MQKLRHLLAAMAEALVLPALVALLLAVLLRFPFHPF